MSKKESKHIELKHNMRIYKYIQVFNYCITSLPYLRCHRTNMDI